MRAVPAPEASACSSASAPAGETFAAMVGPPVKATSTRTESGESGNGYDLREDAVDGVGMDKGDLQAEEATARGDVDQLGALGRQLLERGADVVDLVGDVVDAGAALGEEAADRGVVPGRREQLEPGIADEDGGRLDALVGDELTVLDDATEQALVRRDALVEVGDGDADVMDPPDSTTRCYFPATSTGGARTASTRPYSTASTGVMKRSRSMSSITVSTSRPEWRPMISAICRVVAATSRAAIWMSDGAPRKPALPWWIISFAFGSANRLPAAPPAMIIAAADMPIPKQIVETSGRTCCIAS